MPTYTYRCRSCDFQFDQRQSMADDPLIDCPNCGQAQLRKVINSPGIVFKGSGFYVTDNRNGSSGKRSGSDKSDRKEETESTSATETKTSSNSNKATESSKSSKKKAAPVS